jgi:penicillin-binding protein 1A
VGRRASDRAGGSRRDPLMLRVLRGTARGLFIVFVLIALGAAGFAGVTLAHFGRDLPDYQSLAGYLPATGTKVYAGDGSFVAEFESEHRIPVPIAKVPKLVIDAFLAAEDRDFYNHQGVNPGAIFRAAMADVLRFHRGQRPMGASTITQQVVRHFLLNNEVSVTRKIKEALLAYRIEHSLSKDRILEIYLNESYLGAGAYGVAAAADTYFQKPLERLSLSEAAFLAALPKAPNNYNPIRHPEAARARRDWVLAGMADVGWINANRAKAAMAEPLGVHLRNDASADPAGGQPGGQNGYVAEEVRRELVGRFGEKAVYEGGFTVRTSYVPAYQKMAETAFRKGLVDYDRRHGWRGPITHLASGAAAQAALSTTADPPGTGPGTGWQLAAVTAIDAGGATLALKSGATGRIPLGELQWARRTLDDQRLGAGVRQVHDVVNPGDIVLVEPVATAAPPAKSRHGKVDANAVRVSNYSLRQIPDVSGGVVVMDPKTGRIFALVGGWSFQQSQFNRATQAKRQPGSAFKPFVYVTALANGFTPSSTVDDSPISISQGPGLPAWEPVNYEGGYVGLTTLEDALIHSRNLVTARLATMVGLPAIAETVQNFDVMDRMPLYYSMALGAGETTLLRLTSGYAMLDNGGHWLLPSVIDVVQDRDGRVVYQKGVKDCAACFVAAGPSSGSDTSTLYRPAGPPALTAISLPNAAYADNAVLYKPTKPDPLVTPEADSELISMMQGVVQRGTGTAVAAVGKPLAGKTGTTSDWFDAWFVGFSPDLVAGVFVGFDDPRTLGQGEVGGHVAAPIFRDFMAAALKDVPAKPFPVAPGAAVVANTSTRWGSDAAAGSSRWSQENLATRNDDANTNVYDPDPPDAYDGRRSERDYSGSTKRRSSVRGTRDYGWPAATEDSSQPQAAQRWTTPDWVSPPNTTRRSAATIEPQDAETPSSERPSLAERRAVAPPVLRDSGERDPAAARTVERRPEQNSVERRPVEQNSVDRRPDQNSVDRRPDQNSVERKPAEQNSVERNTVEQNSAERGATPPNAIARGAWPPPIPAAPVAPGRVPPVWPGYATMPKAPGFAPSVAAAQASDNASHLASPGVAPSWTPSYPAPPGPGFPPPPGYAPQYPTPAWGPR